MQALCAFAEEYCVNAKKSLVLAVALLGLFGGAQAHEAHADHPALQSPPPASNASATLQPPAARYELKSGDLKTEWYLWRADDSIETADQATGQNNIWARLGQNGYSYRRVFNKDQRVVEYSPGEIRTRNAAPDWSKLASVISPQLLGSLRRGISKTQFGQKSVRYSGTINDQKIDLWWLEKSQLPAQLLIAGHEQHLEMRLREIHDQAPASWPRATEEKVAAYGLIDAADFGDMESDPFVARVMHQEGHQHTH